LTYAANNVDLSELKNGLGSITATYNDKRDIKTLTIRAGKTKFFECNAFGQVEYTLSYYFLSGRRRWSSPAGRSES
jgi:hypothetical protein